MEYKSGQPNLNYVEDERFRIIAERELLITCLENLSHACTSVGQDQLPGSAFCIAQMDAFRLLVRLGRPQLGQAVPCSEKNKNDLAKIDNGARYF